MRRCSRSLVLSALTLLPRLVLAPAAAGLQRRPGLLRSDQRQGRHLRRLQPDRLLHPVRVLHEHAPACAWRSARKHAKPARRRSWATPAGAAAGSTGRAWARPGLSRRREPSRSATSARGAAALITIDRQRAAQRGRRPDRRRRCTRPTCASRPTRRRACSSLTGAGGVAFCAGADLKATRSMARAADERGGPDGLHAADALASRRSPRSPASAWPAAWRSRCGAICGSPPRLGARATPSAAGACR